MNTGSPDQQGQSPILQVMKIVWGAMFFSQGLLLAVAWILSANRVQDPTGVGQFSFSHPVILVLAAAAIAAFAAGMTVHRWFGVDDETGQVTVSLLSPAEPQKVMPRYFARLALIESSGVFGFVVAFLTLNLLNMIPFLAVASAGFLLSFPSSQLLENLSGR